MRSKIIATIMLDPCTETERKFECDNITCCSDGSLSLLLTNGEKLTIERSEFNFFGVWGSVVFVND